MVFIDRTRQDGAEFKSSLEVGCSRAKEATVVPVVTVNGHKLGEVAGWSKAKLWLRLYSGGFYFRRKLEAILGENR